MRNKRFIFTVTSGRSGTKYLARIIGLFGDTLSLHEPEPSYVMCMREVQSDPNLAVRFLLEKKIPAISRDASKRIYVETSHLFCKGFLEAWLSLPELPIPDLVLLDRDLRSLALSLLRLDTIPGRTVSGLRWYLAPSDQSCLTSIENWRDMNDYQLCYWYCLEIEERKNRYKELIQSVGGRAVRISIQDLKRATKLRDFQKQLDLPALSPAGWLRYFAIRSNVLNRKESRVHRVIYTAEEMDGFEAQVNACLLRKN